MILNIKLVKLIYYQNTEKRNNLATVTPTVLWTNGGV